jgi:hypothetical protein
MFLEYVRTDWRNKVDLILLTDWLNKDTLICFCFSHLLQPQVEVPTEDSNYFKRKRDPSDNGHGPRSKKTAAELSAEEKDRILQMVENEPEV